MPPYALLIVVALAFCVFHVNLVRGTERIFNTDPNLGELCQLLSRPGLGRKLPARQAAGHNFRRILRVALGLGTVRFQWRRADSRGMFRGIRVAFETLLRPRQGQVKQEPKQEQTT